MPQPTITDDYWFAYSKTVIDTAISARNDAAAKLQTLVVWLWTVYTTFITVGATLQGKHYTAGLTLFLATPSLLLILAYWLCTRTQMPVDVQFDPRRPADIRKAYADALRHKRRHLHAAEAVGALGAALVAAALFTTGVYQAQPVAPEPHLTMSTLRTTNGAYLRVDAFLPKVTAVTIAATADGAQLTEHLPLNNAPVLKDILLTAKMRQFSATATYEQDGRVLTTQQRFDATK